MIRTLGFDEVSDRRREEEKEEEEEEEGDGEEWGT